MSAARVDLSLDQGSDFIAQITWVSASNQPFKVVEPMRMDIKNEVGVTALSLVSSPSTDLLNTGLSYNTDSGLIQIYINYSDTEQLASGQYSYDLFVSYTDSALSGTVRRHRLLAGSVFVSERVTQGV